VVKYQAVQIVSQRRLAADQAASRGGSFGERVDRGPVLRGPFSSLFNLVEIEAQAFRAQTA
jgi:hypothetical protein